MNKFLKSLVLLPILLFSFSVSAIDINQPLDCCILKSDVDMGDGVPYSKGDTVGSEETCLLGGEADHHVTKEWGLICLLGSVGSVAHWVFIVLMVTVPLMIMLGAYNIVTSGVDPKKIETGKNYIIYAAIGLLVGLFANAIPNFIASLISG